ncbi:DUF6414 family protein [Serinicoccus chungangensis]|uniref:DUF6414 family protein n=1 Tax=Serinicoccus chungangensis TaxID=767452 RepID=UPI00137A660A|nr:hypothetical protein [Serinicoccus chungangensis]
MKSEARRPLMILREYLYVDTTAVRGILAQLDAGIVESETSAKESDKKSAGGVKGFVEHAQNWSEARTTTKAMADALFPQLEDALESEGLLEDVSELINSDDFWAEEEVQERLHPGKIVRVTAPGYLIDARFIATILGGFAAVDRGMVNMGITQVAVDPVLPPKAKGPKSKPYKEMPGESENLEGGIPIGRLAFGDENGISGEFLRGVVQVTRGMFAPGLHLSLAPDAEGAGAISVRLQEGRQFLDVEPDILFANYGVGVQEWTVVGTIGHHPLPTPDLSDGDFMFADGEGVRRGEFGRYVNQLGTTLANLGFTDLPQAPGFSLIPWAVYRTIAIAGVGKEDL